MDEPLHTGPDAFLIPTPDAPVVTLFLTVRDVARSRDFYSRVLGGTVLREENPCMVRLFNSSLIMNPGGGPTPDKPDIDLVPYEATHEVSSFMNLRVADIRTSYGEWSERGAQFLTPPIDRGPEVRCYIRDPDNYLIEVGQFLEGRDQAEKRPQDLPG